MIKLVNLGMIKEEHFESEIANTILSESGKKLVLKTFQDKLKDTLMDRKLKRKISYKGLIRQECYKILNDIALGETYKPLVAWW